MSDRSGCLFAINVEKNVISCIIYVDVIESTRWMMEYFLKSEKSLKKLQDLRLFLLSNKWMVILFCITAVFAGLHSYFDGISDVTRLSSFSLIGTIVMAYITGFCFVITGDILAMLIPALFTYMIAIRCYNSLNAFMSIWYVFIPVILMVLFNIIAYRKKLSFKGSQFKPMLLVSLAVMLGGIGFISPKEYFGGSSIYHMLGIGFGMLFVYCFFYSKIDINKDYSLIEKLTKIMVFIGLFASFMVILHYLININIAIDKGGIFFIRWRNNISTILMIAMPFAFFYGNKRQYAVIFGFIYYLAILLSGSRGGMVFASIEIVMCIVMFVLYDHRRRLAYAIVCGCILFGVLIFLPQITNLLNNTFERLFKVLNEFVVGGENSESRVRLYAQGIKDFFNQPIFGTGLGYMGNREIFRNKAGALCWYHCEPIQIAASFGVVGIVAFVYQAIKRLALIWKKATLFNMTIFLSYISLEMMSLVNPGILCPVPYLLLTTLFLVIVEKCYEGEQQERISIFKKLKHISNKTK